MHALILSEPYAGLQAQAVGLAERAGLEPALRPLRPRGLWSHLPARFWPDPATVLAFATEPPLPGLIIGCGGVAAALGAQLRTRGHQVVQVQNPRMDPRKFDLVVVNAHDGLTGANVIVTRTALHRITPTRLAQARARWERVFAALPRPLVSVLVGGSNGRFRLDSTTATALAHQLAGMMRAEHWGLALTPSRRTAPSVMAAMRAVLEPLGAWIWNGVGDNPYEGLLACADAIVVTGDSVSMISEAAATEVPVLIAPLPGRSRRIAAFTAGLLAAGRVRLYSGALDCWPTARLDDTDLAASALRDRLGCPPRL